MIRRMTTQEIVPDAEVERVHGHANFGSMTKRVVVDDGILKRAFGYHCGSTQLRILVEHGLVRIRSPFDEGSLTGKGRRYLRALGSTLFDLWNEYLGKEVK